MLYIRNTTPRRICIYTNVPADLCCSLIEELVKEFPILGEALIDCFCVKVHLENRGEE